MGVPASNAPESAEPPSPAASAEPAEPTAPRPRRRRSKIDPYLHLVGVLTDREVAERAGITADGVRMYRHRHGIPAANGRGRRAVAAQPHRAPAVPTDADMKAFAVTIESGEASEEYVVVGADIVSAASRALGIIRGRGAEARVTSVRYLAQTLGPA